MTGRDRLGLCGLALALAGCADMIAEDAPPRVDASGTVRLGRSPIRGGWVEFWPVDGTVGNLRTAPVAADGSFRVSRLTPGRWLVRLVRPADDGTSIDRARLARLQRLDSPARVAIPIAGTIRLDIDLLATDIE